jgi:hypothetical protein
MWLDRASAPSSGLTNLSSAYLARARTVTSGTTIHQVEIYGTYEGPRYFEFPSAQAMADAFGALKAQLGDDEFHEIAETGDLVFAAARYVRIDDAATYRLRVDDQTITLSSSSVAQAELAAFANWLGDHARVTP